MTLYSKKKLLVLDVNGLLVERFFHADKRPEHRSPDGQVGKFYVYKRPYCTEFLTFCFEKFEVGLWSSAQQHNVQNLVDFVLGDLKSKLVFTWHQSDCTDTGLRTLDNKMKPVFLKELYKLWSKLKPDLPWEEGEYGPFNTLLIDDTPYKAMRNPPHTAIFPDPYEVSNEPDDALGGALRKYLEGIADATNVQDYVKHHPFGQLPISEESPQWHFYRTILSLPTVNRNSSSIVETDVKVVANKTLPSIAYNNGSTKSSSRQQCSVPSIEREDDGLAETVVSCMTERNGTLVTTFTKKHATLNGVEDYGLAKAMQPRKKRRNSVMEADMNQEHDAHSRSVVGNEAAFGISQQSDLGMVLKNDGCSETVMTSTAEKIGAIVSTISNQKHATSENKKVDSRPDKYHVENNTLKRSGRDFRDSGSSIRGHHYKASHFNKDYRDCSNRRQSYNFHTNTGGSRTCPFSRRFEGNYRHQNDVNANLQTQVAQAVTYAQTNTGGSQTSHFPREFERNCSRQTDVNSTIQRPVAVAGTYAQANTGGIQNSRFPRKFERKWIHQNDGNATCQTQMAKTGTYAPSAQTNNGGNRTSYYSRKFEGNAQTNNGGNRSSHYTRKVEENWRNRNDVNATLRTQVAQSGTYANNNAFGRSIAPENLFGYQGRGYANEGHYQSWANQHSHFWGGPDDVHNQNHNHLYNPRWISHSYSEANHMRRK